MKTKPDFKRMFLIFKSEDKVYKKGQEPSGYIKIEIRNGRGKLEAWVQNMKEITKTSAYKLYLIKAINKAAVSAEVGILRLEDGKGKIKWEFDPYNVANTGCRIGEFNVAAVLTGLDKKNSRIICPLVAYKNKKIDWRTLLNKSLYSDKGTEKLRIEKEEEIAHRQDVVSKCTVDIESKYIRKENEAEEIKINETLGEKADNRQIDKQKDNEETIHLKIDESLPQNENKEEEAKKAQSLKDEASQEEPGYEEQEETEESLENGQTQSLPKEENDKGSIEKNKQDGWKNEVNSERSYGINNVKQRNEGVKKQEGDLNTLITKLDKNFQKYNPFRTRRRDYTWWKLSSPVHLNNILYQCNIKTPLLFNPTVMMSHFKYRHLIIGVYTDRMKRKEYLVCGIPGVYQVDERPFGEMCRWVQLEGTRPRYGAFGYWLVYINPKDGKILGLR